jgi:hypothetical protein
VKELTPARGVNPLRLERFCGDIDQPRIAHSATTDN